MSRLVTPAPPRGPAGGAAAGRGSGDPPAGNGGGRPAGADAGTGGVGAGTARQGSRPSSRLSLRLPSEAALVAVGAATLVGFRRLFTDWSFLDRPALVLVGSHLLAMALRRRRVMLVPAIAISAVAGVLVCTWMFYGDTTGLGVPTGLTLERFAADLREAVELFRDVEAPAEPLPGFVVATALAFWVTAFLADWSAFRLWAPFEAVLPAAGLFLFASLFGADHFRGPSALVFGAAVLTFLLVHRASRLEAGASWLRGDARRGSRALVRAGLGLAGAAVVVGAAAGPLLPGARSGAVVDWKELGGGDGTRVTVSPLVDIHARLVEQSEIEVFTVRSDRRAYWRLTALDSFDGRLWRSSRRFSKVRGTLERGAAGRARTELVQQNFSIGALSQLWLPAAFEPRQVDAGDVETRWEPSTSTLIVDEESSDDLEYTVVSEIPSFEETRLRAAVGGPPESLREQFLQLPEGFSPSVAELARQVTANATTPFERARALQDFFQREFAYSLDVPEGHGDDRLEQFLFETRTGYCEQFAGAFAAMARSLGLPARVAVGFTPGDADAADPSQYHVKGKHAHAWPEVYLTGAGWVLFEPTPTRGAPAADYTGLPERQDSPGLDSPPLETPTTAAPQLPGTAGGASSGAGAVPAEGELPIDPVVGDVAVEAEKENRPWAGWVLYLVLGGAALYVAAVVGTRAVLRAWRRRRATGANARIDLAWQETVASLGVLGLRGDGTETPVEFAERARRRSGLAAPELVSLARLATEARYSGRDLGPDGEQAARAGSVAVIESVRAQTSLARRLGDQLSPRALWRDRARPSGAARRRARAG